MIESRFAVPFPNAIFKADILLFLLGCSLVCVEEGYGGRDGLDAAVEGRGVDALD